MNKNDYQRISEKSGILTLSADNEGAKAKGNHFEGVVHDDDTHLLEYAELKNIIQPISK